MRKILAAVVAVLVVSCGQAALKPASRQPLPKPFSPPSSWALFVTGDQSQPHNYSRTRLDAATLNDAGGPVSALGYATVSADGSTLAEVAYNSQGPSTITITDVRTDTVRTGFQSSFATGPTLTPDGSRLLAFDSSGHGYRVFDTSNGHITGSLDTADAPCCDLFSEWLDPTGTFLYAILAPGSGWNATGPVTPVLVRYDLHAGHENARLKLNDVAAGVWRNGQTVGSEPETAVLQPGAALSPDGSQIAVLYDDGSRLMTIDPIAMKVTATRSVGLSSGRTSASFFDPVVADAKAEVGTTWSLTYSPDGRQLVATEHQMTIDPKTHYSTVSGTGARLIDIRSATVVADRAGLDIQELAFAPDASAIYATRWSADDAGQAHTELIRLDPSNLATAVQRTLLGSRWLLLLAR